MLEKPIFQGEKVMLRPIRAEDAAALFAQSTDKEVNRLTGTTQTFTLGQYKAHYKRVGNAEDRADYAVVSSVAPDVLLGEVVLNDIDWHNRSANFRIALLNENFFGKGYGTESTRLIVKYGFETLNLHRIELGVFEFNPRAVRVYEKAGFKREGVKRDVLFWEGSYHNAIMMSILKPDYEKQ